MLGIFIKNDYEPVILYFLIIQVLKETRVTEYLGNTKIETGQSGLIS